VNSVGKEKGEEAQRSGPQKEDRKPLPKRRERKFLAQGLVAEIRMRAVIIRIKENGGTETLDTQRGWKSRKLHTATENPKRKAEGRKGKYNRRRRVFGAKALGGASNNEVPGAAAQRGEDNFLKGHRKPHV